MMTQYLDLESIRQRLKELETWLLNHIQAARDESGETSSPDSATSLDSLYSTWVQDQMIDGRDEERLEQVQSALRRLDEGSYGKCIECGGTINPERLHSLPYAELCIRCQRKQEDFPGKL